MDCSKDEFINMDCNELLDWQEEQYSLPGDPQTDLSSCLWDELNTGDEDSLLYMLDEQTPAKQCLDFGYSGCSNADFVEKQPIEVCSRESSLVKRRRMLLFDSNPAELMTDFNQQLSSAMIGSEAAAAASHWNQADHSGDSAFDSQLLDQSSGEWLSNCLDDSTMLCDEMFSCGVSQGEIDISEYCNLQPEEEEPVKVSTPQQLSTPSRIKIKSRKSSISLPTTPAASVAYPFTLIKPCGVQGDVTLSDINHRIRTPSPKKLQCIKEAEKPPIQYPTSALSGKPVVAKTKIRTEGGKGSITITRTKG